MKDYRFLRTCFFYFIILVSVVSAQEKQKIIFLEHNSIIADSSQKEILSYKIPYKNLLFTKNDDVYSSSFTLTLEFYKKDEFVFRDIVKENLSIISYDETTSKTKYYQNFIEFIIPPGEYELRSFLSLKGTDLEYKIPKRKLKIDSLSESKVITPIITNSNNSVLNNNVFSLANFGNKIPFSPNKFDLLVGVNDADVDNITVVISQLEDEIYRDTLPSIGNGHLSFEKIDNDINLSIRDSSNINYYNITGFSKYLYEGKAELTVSVDSSEQKFDIFTTWIGKPDILGNPEYSIKILGYVAEDEIIGELLSSSEEDYYKNLSEYWIETYPANGMKFNYAMDEFYDRADHAVKNFSSLNAYDGAERDRGEVYILYGPPSSLQRNYTEMNEVIEVWTYEKTGREFVFKDLTGTGKFDIAK